MKTMLVVAALLSLAACSTRGPTDAGRLAMIQAHAGQPVTRIRYFNPIAWDKIDGQHLLLTMRPNESWLMRLSGPCLDWGGGSPVLLISSQFGFVSRGFDRVSMANSELTCRIEEIRPVDTRALRAAETLPRSQGVDGY